MKKSKNNNIILGFRFWFQLMQRTDHLVPNQSHIGKVFQILRKYGSLGTKKLYYLGTHCIRFGLLLHRSRYRKHLYIIEYLPGGET